MSLCPNGKVCIPSSHKYVFSSKLLSVFSIVSLVNISCLIEVILFNGCSNSFLLNVTS